MWESFYLFFSTSFHKESEVGREPKSQEMPEPTKPCFGSPHSTAVSSATVNITSPPISSPEPLFSPLLQASTDSSQEQPYFDGRSSQQLQQKAVFDMAESAGDIESPYIGRDNTFLPLPELQASWTVLPLVSTFRYRNLQFSDHLDFFLFAVLLYNIARNNDSSNLYNVEYVSFYHFPTRN